MRFPSLPADRRESSVTLSSDGIVFPVDIVGDIEDRLSDWLVAVAKTYDAQVGSLDYILCDDAILHAMNVEHLGHDTLTDIITFDLHDRDGDDVDAPAAIQGECYISLERVRDNARAFGRRSEVGSATGGDSSGEREELLRVMAHGLLHLCGLDDKDAGDIAAMRAAEDRALYIWRTGFAPAVSG